MAAKPLLGEILGSAAIARPVVNPDVAQIGERHPLQGTLDRRDITVTLLNEERNPVVVWKLRRCLPIKYVGPTLSAGESDVAIEEIELAVEGLEIEQIS